MTSGYDSKTIKTEDRPAFLGYDSRRKSFCQNQIQFPNECPQCMQVNQPGGPLASDADAILLLNMYGVTPIDTFPT